MNHPAIGVLSCMETHMMICRHNPVGGLEHILFSYQELRWLLNTTVCRIAVKYRRGRICLVDLCWFYILHIHILCKLYRSHCFLYITCCFPSSQTPFMVPMVPRFKVAAPWKIGTMESPQKVSQARWISANSYRFQNWYQSYINQ